MDKIEIHEKDSEEADDSCKNAPRNSDETADLKSLEEDAPKKPEVFDSIIDVSGKSFDFPVVECQGGEVEGLYVYKNTFNLIPKANGGLGRLKTLKFFANDVNLFPPGELKNLVELECLQVKVALPGLSGLDLQKLKGLKELELCKVPSRPSAFPIFRDITGLKRLTKLSVCHFSIRFLPPEIGYLINLEYLDISFNKMRNLPTEITYLNSLLSLKVANNKLVEVPSGLSSLQKLENLDLSHNRLTSLENLDLGLMHNLQRLNLQDNKLLQCCDIPSWICCNLEGSCIDDLFSSSSEMDVLEETNGSTEHGSSIASLSHLTGSAPNSRCFGPRKSKRWKRRQYLQQRARQERLNNIRKWRVENQSAIQQTSKECGACEHSGSTTVGTGSSKEEISSHSNNINSLIDCIDLKKDSVEKCSCVVPNSIVICKEVKDSCIESDRSLESFLNAASAEDEVSSAGVCDNPSKPKRHFDGVLENPKPRKTRRPTNPDDLSRKYSDLSFCSTDDLLPDGFYDAGRDRPFMPLSFFDQNLQLSSREVILVDRQRDEGLDSIVLRAQALVFRFRQINGLVKERGHVIIDHLQVASLLALFVSDHFGGSDRSAVIQRARKDVSGSNYRKPFVCTCSTGNADSMNKATEQSLNSVHDIFLLDLCERSLHSIKSRQNSAVVPIGSLPFGICRHRALLMKYLCDRIEPHIPCELVRGYLDFSPHAWNVIVTERGGRLVRMIVDACHPHDIREETDPEYFCRYVPLSRVNSPLKPTGNSASGSFPSLSASDEVGKVASTTLIQCKLGSLEALAKVRTLEVQGSSIDEIRNFEFNCIGEIRMLGVLKHSCIVEFYGHQISSKWNQSADGNTNRRLLRSAILMEHVKGGSLKSYLEKVSGAAGEKCLPVELALFIARDVASALRELHSRHIIHRDIKTENVLIDLDKKRDDGTPTVKLCDFDRAIPLRSYLHTCCIAHTGIPPPDVCVGTPRWMSPEVFRAMHERNMYGLEADIWSFGCLLLELLTLQVPYAGLPESDIHSSLQMGKRPKLIKELEAMAESREKLEDLTASDSGTDLDGPQSESVLLRFLVSVYYWCTEKNPCDRPTAESLHNVLLNRACSVINSSRSSGSSSSPEE
nr:Mitogen-activated protein kinase kinase kinase [Ipomoea batatas]GME09967.1 Mitogen-activated protein kinase kinase kinase [Ipomoea batatas]GME14351.1 Mitogen-activated protein kinase kinase kinase [Ipomoea batatas]